MSTQVEFGIQSYKIFLNNAYRTLEKYAEQISSERHQKFKQFQDIQNKHIAGKRNIDKKYRRYAKLCLKQKQFVIHSSFPFIVSGETWVKNNSCNTIALTRAVSTSLVQQYHAEREELEETFHKDMRRFGIVTNEDYVFASMGTGYPTPTHEQLQKVERHYSALRHESINQGNKIYVDLDEFEKIMWAVKEAEDELNESNTTTS